jgi:uncharacterized membrane protein YciS (DUF1049 family)
MENNVIQDYISIASKFGITSLVPLGFLVGFAVAYFIFST